jgi:GNAT superfamily N-acetyltransferase
MRFLLDTNILIPLENSQVVLEESLAHFVRLANEHGHQLVYHPASEDDISRDADSVRRGQTIERLKQYIRLQDRIACPWNAPTTNPNDRADNEILYALKCESAHALVTEDRGIHDKAKRYGLIDRVYTIQTARDWLRRLHEKINVRLPNIEDRELSFLTPNLGSDFFNSLRQAYGFDKWFRDKAREGKAKAWVAWEAPDRIGAICIYAQQTNETITEDGITLKGAALKLCTFKVAEPMRGQKIGELFLKAAFRYATANHLENIFIHGDEDQHHLLFELLEDFGFERVGSHPGSNGRDAVYVKKHPVQPPSPTTLEPFNYFKSFFPHFRHDSTISKFVVPIRPTYHEILFPDFELPSGDQLNLFRNPNSAGNAIKLAYLCHAQTKEMNPGDVVLFYRSGDLKALTTIGVVEHYAGLRDATEIAALVKRRTVYSMKEIEEMARKSTRVMLFRLIRHFSQPLSKDWLITNGILTDVPQSITKIKNETFDKLLANAQ